VTSTYAVIDNFLSKHEHLALWDAFQQTALSPNRAGEWNRVYQLMNGEDLVSSQFQQRQPELRDGTGDNSPASSSSRLLGETLLTVMRRAPPPIAIDPWTCFSQSAWTYRAGAGLEWHSDKGWLAGYIYYAHPVWRSSWGGELLIGTGDAQPPPSADARSAVETVCETGGVFVYPRPNRLVLLSGGTMHCIKKVESAAGDAFRASVSGFFFNALGANDGRSASE
jgi:hypothetical protein